ncbi:MAG: arsenosugar biosynthesis radical SAM (seleno)protein ArsS [Gammaproteobacteria bacterium]
MHDTLKQLQKTHFPALNRTTLQTLQVNLGYRCNQSCLHCHVNAGPNRTESMSRETIDEVLTFMQRENIQQLDLTGGAPEMNPGFRYIVAAAREMGANVIDRCNLTILNEPGYEYLSDFLAEQRVEVVASLPCYLEENVESQRGKGVYASSLEAIQKLNQRGYGIRDSGLLLNLMYNPAGASLPAGQQQLEQDYKRELFARAGIVFNQLFVLANMPIQRFGSTLISKGQFDKYMQMLQSAHQDDNLDSVMCRTLLSIDWQGRVYDCDFNQMLNLPLFGDQAVYLKDLDSQTLPGADITVAGHCYGCTAGQGSSCGGAL